MQRVIEIIKPNREYGAADFWRLVKELMEELKQNKWKNRSTLSILSAWRIEATESIRNLRDWGIDLNGDKFVLEEIDDDEDSGLFLAKYMAKVHKEEE